MRRKKANLTPPKTAQHDQPTSQEEVNPILFLDFFLESINSIATRISARNIYL